MSGKAFEYSCVEHRRVKKVEFGLFSPEWVKSMSVAKIDVERIYDDKQIPQTGAINDPRMGTMDRNLHCYTCQGSQTECPGHFGHIELAKPVYHYGLIEYARKVLRCVCFHCSRLLLNEPADAQRFKGIKNTKTRFNAVFKVCDSQQLCNPEKGGCGNRQPKYTRVQLTLYKEEMQGNQDEDGGKSRVIDRDSKEELLPEECQRILSRISSDDLDTMGFNEENAHPAWMIIKNLPVAPPPVRPSVATTARSEDDLTHAYFEIIKMNNKLQSQLNKGGTESTIKDLRECIQYYVATLMDNEIQGIIPQKQKSGRSLKAIRARLRGKEGRMRGNLMGKRVDFSARTVITPDPNLQLDQLGVPRMIAGNLTIPERVTSQNLQEMRKLVENGPTTWPGAKYIIRDDERQIDLSQLTNRSDCQLEVGYIVERHLRDDDYVLFNRQPSLHKMSIMGHRVKVLPFQTFRLNLSVTSPYNADFDGDEMNMHVPQSYETMAEIKEIMHVPKQIVSPRSNQPVMGIVQDSLLGIMRMTLKDTFVDSRVVMDIMMWVDSIWGDSSSGSVKIPTPAIIKPKPLWTGKQLLTMVIPKMNFCRFNGEENEFKGQDWMSSKDETNRDSSVYIKNGELLCGVITKSSVGASQGGIIHVIWKDHGPYICRDFLSNTQKVVNNWLVNTGFTVGVADIIASDEVMAEVKNIINDYTQCVQKIVQKTQLGKLQLVPGKSMMETFEAKVNEQLNAARDRAGKLAFTKLSKDNRLRNMVFAGSKGGPINISQIMACVGQQNVEGKRIPFGFNKRSLPHFSKDDFGPESKGFVENSYLLGLTPQEFFFHAMGGREGLIDTAVKTSETGYIQRRLIKALEDVMVKYDGTVRNSHEHIIQFLYGEDAMAGEHIENMFFSILLKSDQDLKKMCSLVPDKDIPPALEAELCRSMESHVVQALREDVQTLIDLEEEFQQIKKDRDFLRQCLFKEDDQKTHLPVNVPRILINVKEERGIQHDSISDLTPRECLDQVKQLIENFKVYPGCDLSKDPLIYEANENATMLFKIFIRQQLSTRQVICQHRLTRDALRDVIEEIQQRFKDALARAGECIGSIAAQSIGEPATQMTLNTFHLAGVSAKNVTLGVPRLKEIINVAKTIKTPSLQVFLKKQFREDQDALQRVHGLMEYTTINDVLLTSGIYYDPDPENTILRADKALVESYVDAQEGLLEKWQNYGPWVLRIELDSNKLAQRTINIEQIEDKIVEHFNDQLLILRSDINDQSQVMRIRFIKRGEDTLGPMELKQIQERLLNDLALKGFKEISKVYRTKFKTHEYGPDGKYLQPPRQLSEVKTYFLETDGVALAKVFTIPEVDHTKTISNSLLEILQVLGIEAVRKTLIKELRVVLTVYGIYINYRHLSTLCDVMTHRGILTSITRHGINRVDTGPLRKASFEETVEILYEAAVFHEIDNLKGITENIIMGQLAPFGTGSFDLVLDTTMLAPARENEGLETSEYVGQEIDDGMATPEQQLASPQIGEGGATPAMSMYGQSERDAAFSAYAPGSEYQMSARATPVHTPGRQQATGFYNPSPAYGQPTGQSPVYSPTTPFYNAGATKSPGYSPAPNMSPAYNTANPGAMSPAYSVGSQGYSPTSPGYNAATAGGYGMGATVGQSMQYSPAAGSAHSGASGSGYSPQQAAYNPGASFMPSSPAYNPAAVQPSTQQKGNESPLEDEEE